MMRSIQNHPTAMVLVVGFLLVAAGSSGSTAVPAAEGAPSKNDAAVKKAMRGIHSDLKKLKFKFFQLRDIENAKVYNNEFRYTMGLERDNKAGGPSFARYGCDIYVHIQYPATKQDIEHAQLLGELISLKNGIAYAVWKLTRTEPTQEGQAFADRVNQIVTARLDAMKRELDQE